MVDGQLIIQDDDIRHIWGRYFSDLSQDADVTSSEKCLTGYMRILARLDRPPPPIVWEDKDLAISKLKKGKAPDIHDPVSEQIKPSVHPHVRSLPTLSIKSSQKGKFPHYSNKPTKSPYPRRAKITKTWITREALPSLPYSVKLWSPYVSKRALSRVSHPQRASFSVASQQENPRQWQVS